MTSEFKAQSRFTVVSKKDAVRNFKPKAWNHQDDLKGLIGKWVNLVLANGEIVEGTLVAADQFTIKISEKWDDGTSFDAVYFKSSLTSFFPKV